MQPGGHNTLFRRALRRSSSKAGNSRFFHLRRAQELSERLRDERLTRFVQVGLVGKIYVLAGLEARFENGVLTLTLAKKVPTGATQLTIS